MWKKWLFPVVVTIVIVSLVMPYWVGIKAEHEFSMLNETLPVIGQWYPVNNQYQRGWFQSQAQTTFRPQQLNQQYATLQHDIQHSITPLQPTKIRTTLQTDNETQSFLQYIFAGRAPFIMETSIYLTGGKSYFRVPPLSMHQGEQAFTWQGLQGQINFGLNGEYLENKFVVPELSLQTQYGKIIVQNVQLNGQAKSNQGIYIGQVQLQVEKIAAAGVKQPSLQLNKIQLILNNNLVNEYLDFAIHAQAQDLQVGQQRYEPHYFDMKIEHIHHPTLMQWQDDFRNISGSQAEKGFIQLGLLAQYGNILLNHQPRVHVDKFHIQTQSGEVTGDFHLQVNKTTATQNPHNLVNPFSILNRLQVEISLNLPVDLLDTILNPQQKQWLLNNKLLVKTQSSYQTQLGLNNGLVNANGMNLPLMQLFLGQ